MGSRACWVTVCAMSPCWHSYLGAQFCGGLCCPSLTQVWQQPAGFFPADTEAVLWPVSYSHHYSKTNWVGTQLHHHQALVHSSSLGIETHLWIDEFLLCLYRKCLTIKKKSFCGMRQWWYLFCIHRGARVIHECRGQMFALPPVDLVWPRLSSRTILDHNYFILPCLPFKSPKKPSHRRNIRWLWLNLLMNN